MGGGEESLGMLPPSKIIGGEEAHLPANPLSTPMSSVSVQRCVPTGMISTALSFQETVWLSFFFRPASELFSNHFISIKQTAKLIKNVSSKLF